MRYQNKGVYAYRAAAVATTAGLPRNAERVTAAGRLLGNTKGSNVA